MSLIDQLWLGFSVALSPMSLAYCLLGALLGTFVGVLPGVGPVATIALLLPVTFTLAPQDAIIMLAAIYYGAQYGGSTTAILINIPGESASVVTAIDGYQMARQGRAGAALGIAAIGSFVAGSVATLVIAVAAPWLGRVALGFRAEDYFSLMVFGLIGAIVLAQGSILRALPMVVLGLLLGLVGTDIATGLPRFTFGVAELSDGISFLSLTIGIFGIAELLRCLEFPAGRTGEIAPVRGVLPSVADLRQSAPAVARGTVVGAVLGLLPGGGALLSSFSAYALEKKLSRHPERFGHGEIRGVAAPESANNAGAQTSFIPLLTLGIPSNPVMALMIGALMVQGIAPGPQVMNERPELFWGLIASMWLGNLMLLVLNLPLVGLWVRLARTPYKYLCLTILVFCLLGIYAVTMSTVDLYALLVFSVLGYVLRKLRCEPAPLALGFILGPLMEENLRRALEISQGDPSVLVSRPLSLSFLIASVLLLVMIAVPALRRRRDLAMQE